MSIIPGPAAMSRGMYIHIPFCLKKCSYCDFYSRPLLQREWLERYTDALLIEIEQQAEEIRPSHIASIYMGGGTPSLLSAEQLSRIIGAVKKSFILGDNAEISIEANPATLELSWLEHIINAGVNRLSIGVQSFSDQELKILGRVHNSKEIKESIELLHKAGLKNFNIDMIYGIPGQTMDDWQNNLQEAVECRPQHISAYLLQPGTNTPMTIDIEQGRLTLLDDDLEAAMYYRTLEFLEEQGFEHYEISNFCLSGSECRHNINYWQAGEYIGIGAGAVSHINHRRYINLADWAEYIKCLVNNQRFQVEELENMSAREVLADAMITGLRMCGGINLKKYEHRFNVHITHEYSGIIESGISKGLLKMGNGQLSLTKKGYFLSNEVLCQFIT
ncbi:MAG: radical SAM family heme chaperone HemW [Syntrophomonadaceae bacterium]|nr:radical SAM family heme chaperone HemW [Syntrophomonadaceae bacterium]